MPPHPSVTAVPKVASPGEHRIVVATEPLHAWDTSVARRFKTLSAVPGELTLCRPNPHPALEAVGLAVLVRSASPLTQNVGAGEGEVHFSLSGWFGESHLMRLV